MELISILRAAVANHASDVHLVPGRPPFLRVNGVLESMSAVELSAEETETLILDALPKPLVQKFREEGELDTSMTAEDVGRFRVNVLRQKDGVGAVLRVIPADIPEPDEIGLDDRLVDLTKLPRGLVLVTGPTGSGKSTTLASLINVINRERREHILTIEDPIEYVYPKLNCVVTQREIGNHSDSFSECLRRAMRQDPDVVLVGEMRDLETISSALTLAETGHLVFATLHTTDAAQTIDRIIDVFPPFQQQQVRTQLSVVLRAVVCQQLLPRLDDDGRVAAREFMVVTPAVGNLIREGKTHQIYSAIELGRVVGMKSLDQDLGDLVRRRLVSLESAVVKANNPDMVRKLS